MHNLVWVDIRALLTTLLTVEEKSVVVAKAREEAERAVRLDQVLGDGARRQCQELTLNVILTP